MATIGIIGFGSFGKFLAEKLSSQAHVKVYDRRERPTTWRADFDDVAACDYVVLSVPLGAYPETLERLATVIAPGSVLVDVCSVKEHPVELIRQYLPKQPLVATHPLFGPESASGSLQGMTMVMCPEVSDAGSYAKIKDFAEKLELSIVEMSAVEHDREMAVVQGLTFFIARTLDDMKLREQQLSTPSFERLLHLAELEQHHSAELFRTIQQGNSYTQNVRRAFMDAAHIIDKELDEETK